MWDQLRGGRTMFWVKKLKCFCRLSIAISDDYDRQLGFCRGWFFDLSGGGEKEKNIRLVTMNVFICDVIAFRLKLATCEEINSLRPWWINRCYKSLTICPSDKYFWDTSELVDYLLLVLISTKLMAVNTKIANLVISTCSTQSSAEIWSKSNFLCRYNAETIFIGKEFWSILSEAIVSLICKLLLHRSKNWNDNHWKLSICLTKK